MHLCDCDKGPHVDANPDYDMAFASVTGLIGAYKIWGDKLELREHSRLVVDAALGITDTE